MIFLCLVQKCIVEANVLAMEMDAAEAKIRLAQQNKETLMTKVNLLIAKKNGILEEISCRDSDLSKDLLKSELEISFEKLSIEKNKRKNPAFQFTNENKKWKNEIQHVYE